MPSATRGSRGRTRAGTVGDRRGSGRPRRPRPPSVGQHLDRVTDGEPFTVDSETGPLKWRFVAGRVTGANATFAKPLSNPNGIPVNASGQIVNQAASPLTPIVLTYYNLGEAKVRGTDAGINFLLTPTVELRGTLSTVKLESASVAGEATSLNSPSTKWTVGTTAKDVGPLTLGNLEVGDARPLTIGEVTALREAIAEARSPRFAPARRRVPAGSGGAR